MKAALLINAEQRLEPDYQCYHLRVFLPYRSVCSASKGL
jgi:hypothetical protein